MPKTSSGTRSAPVVSAQSSLRQAPVGGYIVDFLCVEAKLIVEIDGPGMLIRRPTFGATPN